MNIRNDHEVSQSSTLKALPSVTHHCEAKNTDASVPPFKHIVNCIVSIMNEDMRQSSRHCKSSSPWNYERLGIGATTTQSPYAMPPTSTSPSTQASLLFILKDNIASTANNTSARNGLLYATTESMAWLC